MTTQQHRKRKAVITGLMLALWFGLQALALFPHLHHYLHDDSQGPVHQCFITQLNKGIFLDACESRIPLISVSADLVLPCSEQVHISSAVEYRISLSRAPPASSSYLAVVG